jgi:hypothetical protein
MYKMCIYVQVEHDCASVSAEQRLDKKQLGGKCSARPRKRSPEMLERQSQIP